MDGNTTIQGGAVMIPQYRLIEYASNFLESEIKRIEELLKDDAVDSENKDKLRELLKEYELDLEEAERELDDIRREWM